jgi:hypothetical protein
MFLKFPSKEKVIHHKSSIHSENFLLVGRQTHEKFDLLVFFLREAHKSLYTYKNILNRYEKQHYLL